MQNTDSFRVALGLALLVLFSMGSVQAEPADPHTIKAVREGLGLYLTSADRRDADERIERVGSQLELWFLEPLLDHRPRRVCAGMRWLMAGRLSNSTGAGGVFSALPDVQKLTLVFYRVETQVEPDSQGRYTQHRSAVPTARFTVSRAQAARLNAKTLRSTLREARCLAMGRRLLEKVWIARRPRR